MLFGLAGRASESVKRSCSLASIPTRLTRLLCSRDQLPLPASGACDQLSDYIAQFIFQDEALPTSDDAAM